MCVQIQLNSQKLRKTTERSQLQLEEKVAGKRKRQSAKPQRKRKQLRSQQVVKRQRRARRQQAVRQQKRKQPRVENADRVKIGSSLLPASAHRAEAVFFSQKIPVD